MRLGLGNSSGAVELCFGLFQSMTQPLICQRDTPTPVYDFLAPTLQLKLNFGERICSCEPSDENVLARFFLFCFPGEIELLSHQ